MSTYYTLLDWYHDLPFCAIHAESDQEAIAWALPIIAKRQGLVEDYCLSPYRDSEAGQVFLDFIDKGPSQNSYFRQFERETTVLFANKSIDKKVFSLELCELILNFTPQILVGFDYPDSREETIRNLSVSLGIIAGRAVEGNCWSVARFVQCVRRLLISKGIPLG